jgi:hypothetical protein
MKSWISQSESTQSSPMTINENFSINASQFGCFKKMVMKSLRGGCLAQKQLDMFFLLRVFLENVIEKQ